MKNVQLLLGIVLVLLVALAVWQIKIAPGDSHEPVPAAEALRQEAENMRQGKKDDKTEEGKIITSGEEEINNNQQNTNMDTKEHNRVVLKTNQGDITVELFADKAPKAVENFIKLSKEGFYDGVKFHRVIKGFMIQGGDPLSKTEGTAWGTGGPGYKFEDELPQAGEYEIGSLAMANSGPNTNGSQFFIVTGADGVGLPPLYTLFGKVVDGMEVVKKIEATPTDPANDRPLTPMVIEKVIVE